MSSSSLLGRLLLLSPVYSVPRSRLRFLECPEAYLSTLKRGVASAERRVFLSALYLGSDSLSKELVQCARERVERAVAEGESGAAEAQANEEAASLEEQRRPGGDFEMRWLLDYGRATRMENGSSSVIELAPLLPHASATVSLWRTPRLTPWLRWALPDRIDEVVGVQHAKVHVFDDTVVLSGANLSGSYFSNRQDRYVLIEDRQLADFWYAALSLLSRHSFQVLDCDAQNDMRVSAPRYDPCEQSALYTSLLREELNEFWSAQCHSTQHTARTALTSVERTAAEQAKEGEVVYVLPTMQLGAVGFRVDERVTEVLIEEAAPTSTLHITSGYFNLVHSFIERLQRCRATLVSIAASPEANGWFTAKGNSRHVPAAYSTFEKDFLLQLERHGKHVTLLEYKRDGWTYHCKGMWILPHDKNSSDRGDDGEESAGDAALSCSLIGSANLGHRSKELDLEAQVVLVSAGDDFRDALRREVGALQEHCQEVTLQDLQAPQRTPPLFWKLILPYLQKYF